MKLHFGRKIFFAVLVLVLLIVFLGISPFGSSVEEILVAILAIYFCFMALFLPIQYGVLKGRQRKKFLKNFSQLGNIIGMNFDEFTKKMDMPNPKGITKAPEGMAYTWYFSGSRNTGIVVIVDNGIIVDYELNDESAFKYM